MGTSVLLVFLAPMMVFYLGFKAVFSLFGMDFDALLSWFGSTESTDLFLSLFARIYTLLEPIIKPIADMFN